MQYQSIVILTGAGISAESGIPTFRDGDNLWCNQRIEDVATPKGFARDPALVQQFYKGRRAQLRDVAPNAAHHALARLAEQWRGEVTIITQNVDDLHDRAADVVPIPAGYRLLHMHGELKKVRCTLCESIFSWEEDITEATPCISCSITKRLRPHIVWFGEMSLHMGLIDDVLSRCGLFLSIGTSGNVYPAADFANTVRAYGKAHTVEINLEPSYNASLFHEKLYGSATQLVPDYVDRILTGDVIELEDIWGDISECDEEDAHAAG
jgi:NAD-dependent deacetylase